MIKSLFNAANGKKTYTVALGAILVLAGNYIQGNIDLGEVINGVLIALSSATIRHGVSKV